MVCELPHIIELDMNPVMVDDAGVIAVDARILVERPTTTPEPYAHMAIHPYPAQLVTRAQLPDGTDVLVRPIRPEDAEMLQEFVRQLSPETKYFRYMQNIKELTADMLVRFTQMDYDRELALIAVTITRASGRSGRRALHAEPGRPDVRVRARGRRSPPQPGPGLHADGALDGSGAGPRHQPYRGEVLGENHRMLSLMRELGFAVRISDTDPHPRRGAQDLRKTAGLSDDGPQPAARRRFCGASGGEPVLLHAVQQGVAVMPSSRAAWLRFPAASSSAWRITSRSSRLRSIPRPAAGTRSRCRQARGPASRRKVFEPTDTPGSRIARRSHRLRSSRTLPASRRP